MKIPILLFITLSISNCFSMDYGSELFESSVIPHQQQELDEYESKRIQIWGEGPYGIKLRPGESPEKAVREANELRKSKLEASYASLAHTTNTHKSLKKLPRDRRAYLQNGVIAVFSFASLYILYRKFVNHGKNKKG